MPHGLAACTLLAGGRASESAETIAQQHSMRDEGLVHKTAQSTSKHALAKPIEPKQCIDCPVPSETPKVVAMVYLPSTNNSV